MKLGKNNHFIYFCFISLFWLNCLFSGCTQNHVLGQVIKPVFYPAPPSKPRLQFLTSFSGPEDLGASTNSGFEKFILGEPEQKEGVIMPYGMALYDGKLYVCDVGKRAVELFDLKKRTFGYLTTDKRLINPVNIYITNNGMKYISDPTAGAVFVFDKNNDLTAILGRELHIAPIDVAVRGRRCYVSDFNSNQIVVIDIITDKEVMRIGSKSNSQSQSMNDLSAGQIVLISDLTIDKEGNIYVTDKAAGRITKFDSSGKVLSIIGRLGSNIDEFVRPKGIAVDQENRIWVVDSAPEVTKIYDDQARLLLYFGLSGNAPGNMSLPAKVYLDYDNIEYFRRYIVPGADIDFLVLVSNQYGPNKINVYGFGNFQAYSESAQPGESVINQVQRTSTIPQVNTSLKPEIVKPEIPTGNQKNQNDKTVDLYYQSLAFYHNNQLEKAREGFTKVLESGTIPSEMAKSIRQQLIDINSRIATDKEKKDNADLYYRSMSLYRTGQLEQAKEGFIKVLNSGLIPSAMQEIIEGYIEDINKSQNKK